MFGQEGLRWRVRKDIEDLHLEKCSTLYSAVFNNAHSYISWGLDFVGSPGHEIYAPLKFDTGNFCLTKFSTIGTSVSDAVMAATTRPRHGADSTYSFTATCMHLALIVKHVEKTGRSIHLVLFNSERRLHLEE